MVQERKDAITGAVREAVLMNPEDAKKIKMAIALCSKMNWVSIADKFTLHQFKPETCKYAGPRGIFY
jgi:hypothetical protein